jgi:hypothetical protein
MKGAKTTKWRSLAAIAPVLLVLGLRLAVSAAPAAAESSDTAPLRPIAEGVDFPITGPEAPEEYPLLVNLGSEQEMRQIDEHHVAVVQGAVVNFILNAPPAHDVDGATVPTSLTPTGEDIVTVTVHHRAGNPAAGGAAFVYPITEGTGWEGGYRTVTFPLVEPVQPVQPTSTPPTVCAVPSVRGLTLKAAKTRLRGAHCSIGQVRLSPNATKGKGKVVKQFRPAGTEMAAGSAVAVKLGVR